MCIYLQRGWHKFQDTVSTENDPRQEERYLEVEDSLAFTLDNSLLSQEASVYISFFKNSVLFWPIPTL